MCLATRAVADVAAALLDLVAPAVCSGCGDRARLLCDGCLTVLSGTPRTRLVSEGAEVVPVVSAADYSGVARAAVLAFKERGCSGLARPLAGVAVRAALASGVRSGANLLVVPVPSSAAAVRRRGYDPVRMLASAAASLLVDAGVPARCRPALRLTVRVADQAGLTARERRGNLAGAHAVPRRHVPAVAGRSVLVVDDVVTTGATLVEAARALRVAGGRPVGGLTVGATTMRGTQRRPPDGPTR